MEKHGVQAHTSFLACLKPRQGTQLAFMSAWDGSMGRKTWRFGWEAAHTRHSKLAAIMFERRFLFFFFILTFCFEDANIGTT